jgi:apolipoprotein N-acyltransferase
VNALTAFFSSPRLSRLSPLLALIAGAANTLAFAPFGAWWLQIVTLAVLFHLALTQPSLKKTLLHAWLFGLGWAAVGTHWLYISMHDFGGMPSPMAVMAVILLGAYLGLFSAAAMACVRYFHDRWTLPSSVVLLAVLPACWALSEWLRGWLFTGFPWLTSGYAHSQSPFSGLAAVFGVYGLSYLCAFLAALLLVILYKIRLSRPLWSLIIVGLSVTISLKWIDWSQPHGEPISVRLIQGNVAQEIKFTNEALLSTLMLYEDAIRAQKADLIVLPETAIPLLPTQLPPNYLSDLTQYAQDTQSHLAIGIPLSDAPGAYSNSVIGISPATHQSQTTYRYDKQHLVPFGEFVPWGFQWFVDMMDIPLGDMTRGTLTQAAFQVRDQWVLPNICYEDLFGEDIVAQFAYARSANLPLPTILLNVSNIAWFGHSAALPQHLQISQMRAIETARPMLRATNTGTTAVIDPKGAVLAALPPFERETLAAQVQGYTGQTPFVLWGNWAIGLLCLLILGLVWYFKKPFPRN